nr:TPR repeat protein [Ipomoea batatas]
MIMLSAPTLKSIWGVKGPSSSSPNPHTLRTKTSPFSFSPHQYVTIKKTLSRTAYGLHLRGTLTSKTKPLPFHNGYSQFVSKNGSDMSLGMMSISMSWMRDAAFDERCSAPVNASRISGSQFVSKNGSDMSLGMMSMSMSWMRDATFDERCSAPVNASRISGCGGAGGYNGSYDGPGENEWVQSLDEYYDKIIQDNLDNPLFLGNYAKFLKEVKGDFVKAEEYCEWAILANADEGNIFALHADLIWCLHKDAARAESYYVQAVKASPDDCDVLASYAHFLWQTEEEDEEEEDQQILR